MFIDDVLGSINRSLYKKYGADSVDFVDNFDKSIFMVYGIYISDNKLTYLALTHYNKCAKKIKKLGIKYARYILSDNGFDILRLDKYFLYVRPIT